MDDLERRRRDVLAELNDADAAVSLLRQQLMMALDRVDHAAAKVRMMCNELSASLHGDDARSTNGGAAPAATAE